MALKLFKTKNKEIEKKKANSIPFEKREKIYPLSLLITIVNKDQSNYYTQEYARLGCSISLVLYGYSQPPLIYRNMLGIDSTKKEIVLSIARKEDIGKMLEVAKKKFSISKTAKGIAFVLPIDSVNGIAVYRFLADQYRDIREKKDERNKK